MPRKGPAQRRDLKPDEIFGSRMVTRFINKILLGGRKSAAEKVFYGAMELIAERTGENPLVVLRNAMRNVMPNLEVRPRRVGGATYQVPVEVDTRRQLTLAVRWIVGASRARGERTMVQRFAGEVTDAANREGASVRKREEMHRMAEANKAYAHYRW
ncbi:MAG: 30S ribosomal protein S7 [candidate division WS1 bacterium]|nr:30S ribosomal protein S7 [candidate division WS1 bacterium]